MIGTEKRVEFTRGKMSEICLDERLGYEEEKRERRGERGD